MKVVFDTYAWIEYFEGNEKGKIVRGYLDENEIITPLIVLLELSCKSELRGWDLKRHLSFIRHTSEIIGSNEKFVLEFGKIYNEAKKKVKGIGLADCIVLTTARLNEAKVLTGDSHFSKFEEAVIL